MKYLWAQMHMLKQRFYVPSIPLQLRKVLQQAAAGEAAAWVLWLQPGTHEQSLGDDKPCVASPCLPGPPHAVGMRRPPKPVLPFRERHEPQGDLSLMAPGVFTSEQHRL